MKRRFFLISLLSVLSIFLLVRPCPAGAPTRLVKQMLEKVMSVQTDPQLQGRQFREKRRIAIKNIIAENFDFEAMAREALGQYWQKLSSAEGAAFKAIFEDLFQDSYTRLVLDFLKRETILYTTEKGNEAKALVKTTIVKINDEIPVDYFLARRTKRWLVRDVNIDGVSIVQNYRKSFTRVIRRQSYEALVEKMRLQQRAIRKSS